VRPWLASQQAFEHDFTLTSAAIVSVGLNRSSLRGGYHAATAFVTLSFMAIEAVEIVETTEVGGGKELPSPIPPTAKRSLKAAWKGPSPSSSSSRKIRQRNHAFWATIRDHNVGGDRMSAEERAAGRSAREPHSGTGWSPSRSAATRSLRSILRTRARTIRIHRLHRNGGLCAATK